MRRLIPTLSLTGIAAVLLSMAAGGVAYAVSGGGYGSPQQDCPWYASEWNTPQYKTYPGCHTAQLTLESGGITNGNPNNGYNDSPRFGDHGATNIDWLQFGIDQSPNDENSKGTKTLYSIGYPGQSSATHAGCLAVNTDGTKGGAVPEGKKPESVSKAHDQTKYGCGDNKAGAGFALDWDYYQFYCPIAAMIPSFPYKCTSIPGGDIGQNKLSLDTGLEQNVSKVLTEGFSLYYGMDDNSDNGEHDGEGPLSSALSHGSVVGPSDGGAVMLIFTPQRLAQSGTLTQPEGLLNAGTGFCADGICLGATTEKQMIYQGCDANTGEVRQQDRCKGNGKNSERDSFDYTGKKWDPYSCNSGGEQSNVTKPQPDAPANCDTSKKNPSSSGTKNTKGGMDYWRKHEAHTVSNEPGFQFFEDPDAMGSPALPVYPLPGIYVGTCGVALGGGAFKMPNTPLTNKAHQIRISTGC
ncbi:MAG TPA: hypothetical protein VHV76_11120 [Mycobacteriales bacterium]|nr:hypothetical protein [Mycobacteriales bacterium]